MRNIYITKNGTIKRKDNSIIFANEKTNITLPIKDIDNIYLFGEVTLNTKILNFLSTINIPIFVFNYYGFYSGAYYPREKNISGKLLVEQVNNYTNKKTRITIAKQFIEAAIHNMRKTLMQYELTREAEEIKNKLIKIKEIKTIEKLLLFEATTRQFYYKQFNKIIKNNEFRFIQRTRRPPDNFINTLISFGNSLLYTTTLSEILKTQLDPRISYLHEPFERRYSLNLDISEIFKPLIVDRVIFTLINKQIIKKEHFDKELNYCYLNEEGRKEFIKEYDKKLNSSLKYPGLNRKVSYKYMIRLESYKLIKLFMENKKYKPFKIYW